MNCRSCASSNAHAGFTAEINIHFSGLKNIHSPGILVFPTLLICLECGFSQFTIPETELAMLAMCSPKSAASTGEANVRNVAPPRATAG